MLKLDIQLLGGRGSSSSSSSGGGKPNDATEYYVSGEGMWINNYLRGRGDFGELSANEKQYLKELDQATNGNITNSKLFRNVNADAVFGNMTQIEYEDLKNKLVYGANDKYANATAEKFLNNTIGKTVTEKGFMSTTKDENIAKDWGGFTGSDRPIVMEIKTNKNTKGVDLSSYDKNVSKSEAQKEVLLGRNQSYKVDNIKAKNGNIYVEVSMK